MEQGLTEKKIIEQCVMHKMPLPDKIANAPELYFGLELYYKAFLDLTTCRGQGYGTEGPIGWLAIREYADAYDLSGEQREDLFYHIQHMDSAYLDFKAKRLKNKGKEK